MSLEHVAENFCIGQKAKKSTKKSKIIPHLALSRWRAGLKEVQSHCKAWHKFFILPTDQLLYLRVGESIWCLSLPNLDDVDSLATSTGLGSRLLWCALAQTLRVGLLGLSSHSQSFPLIFSKYAQLQISFTWKESLWTCEETSFISLYILGNAAIQCWIWCHTFPFHTVEGNMLCWENRARRVRLQRGGWKVWF